MSPWSFSQAAIAKKAHRQSKIRTILGILPVTVKDIHDGAISLNFTIAKYWRDASVAEPVWFAM